MSYLDKLLEGVEVEWKTLGEVIKLEKEKQLNKELLSEDGLYPAYNGGITFSGFTNIYNYNENTIIISQGGASAGFVNFRRGGYVIPHVITIRMFHPISISNAKMPALSSFHN